MLRQGQGAPDDQFLVVWKVPPLRQVRGLETSEQGHVERNRATQSPDGRLDVQRRTSHTRGAVLASRHKGGVDYDDPPPITGGDGGRPGK